MFSAGELGEMRAASEGAMPDTFRVSVPGVETETGSGGFYNAAPTEVDYSCRKAPVGNGPQERLLAQQIQEVGLEVIVLPWSVDLAVGTVGTWIGGETGESRAYRVIAAPLATFSMDRRYLVVPSNTSQAAGV